ncbi:MAG: NFACT family protein [Clostridia bacterium]|nr:NFACT family protein [Clostridia bacterium]
MAFDACMMRAVLTEYGRVFSEAKIEKVLQPANDEIDLVLHFGKASSRLVFNVGPNAPRLQLSSRQKENPLKAPMLCMLLRKYFTGARIISYDQPGFDRIADFTVLCYDEMGFKVEKHIICEIMGKYANFIVTDADYKVLTALKIIDFAASTVRQVLPGLKYQIPEKPEKLSPLVIDRALFFEKLAEFPQERTAEKFITSTYSGIATQIARELVFRTSGMLDVPVMNIDAERFYRVFSEWQDLLINERYVPTAVLDRDGKPVDYSYMDITYQPSEFTVVRYGSFSELFDMYFAEKDRHERIHQRAHDLITLLSAAEARTERKLAIQRESLANAARAEEYKRQGDLITANMYKIKKGDERVRVIDYYDENCPEVEIILDPRLSAAANAAKAYKLYNKCKTAKVVLTEQISIWEAELVYLDSVRTFLDKAEGEQDLVDIREELYRSGYSSKLKEYRPQKQMKMRPIESKTSGGYTLLIGRNNIQNDLLTFKTAAKHDIWFHTKDIPGSHVIMVTGGKEPSELDYTEAAAAAAYYSKATADLVAVDYTEVKNIKKPPASKPGFVTYKTNYTAFVKPRKPEGGDANG